MPVTHLRRGDRCLFADLHLALDAIYRAGGAAPSVPVHVFVRRPHRVS